MSFTRILLFVLLGSGLCLRGLSQEGPGPVIAPARGTILMTKHEGKLWQLVDVKGRRGVVRSADQECTLSRDQNYLPVRSDECAPGFIEVLDENSSSHYVVDTIHPSSGFAKSTTYITGNQFEAYLLSKTRVEDCCLALIYTNKAFFEGAAPELHCTMVLNRVGTLEAGRKKLVRITITDIKANSLNSCYSVLFLSKGREVKSSMSPENDAIMALIEARQHSLSVGRYVEENKGQDKDLVVYSQEKVRMPPQFDGTTLPESVDALFTVNDEGNVVAVEILGSVPKPVRVALLRSVASWRFLPKLEHGRPTTTAVRLPISLKG